MWRGQIAPLSQQHKLIVWDMRGHGRTDYPQDPSEYSEEKTVADMTALLDMAGAQKAIIGGLSLGGYMSLAFHLAHPERVRALLVIDTGPGFKSDQARDRWNINALAIADRLESEALNYLRSLSSERSRSSHRSADGLVRACRGMLIQRDARVINSLPEIKVPVLVIVGANDSPFLNAADYMAARIPNATKVVIQNAGHAVNIDQPTLFNQAVRQFLEKLEENVG
jgi:pimeloyl-ACP methyl ester carboxylesterase